MKATDKIKLVEHTRSIYGLTNVMVWANKPEERMLEELLSSHRYSNLADIWRFNVKYGKKMQGLTYTIIDEEPYTFYF